MDYHSVRLRMGDQELTFNLEDMVVSASNTNRVMCYTTTSSGISDLLRSITGLYHVSRGDQRYQA